jgi:hypothetical protein
MTLNDLLVDVGKQVQLKREVLDTLKQAGRDPRESARVAFLLMEIGLDAFRTSGMSPFMAMALIQLIAHGATMERALKALMLIQEEDDLKDEADPSRKDRHAAAAHDDDEEDPPAKKTRVM